MGEKRTIILTSTFFNDLHARSTQKQKKKKKQKQSFPCLISAEIKGEERTKGTKRLDLAGRDETLTAAKKGERKLWGRDCRRSSDGKKKK